MFIRPDTPKIGDILKTTCSDDEDEGLEDHGVELDDGTGTSDIALRKRIRAKRQDEEGGDGGSLADLGICVGDILPAIREKHPNQKLEILVKSSQAPSVVLSEGKAHVTLNIDAELYIQSSQEKVGTIAAEIVADIEASTNAGKLSGTATIGTLSLKDKEGTLGLPQDALDNLAGLGKDFAEKAINDALSKGISLDMPAGIGGLPVSFSNPDFRIVDHALYVAADLSVDPVGLAPLLASQGLNLTPDQCSTRGG
uniref:BPI2 domain-containing protein n=1 Tax=Bursaphelenchus xylophilus TaxID=6326 RepID=A0A1I7SAJ0_BURXY